MESKFKELYKMYQFRLEEDRGNYLVFSYRMGYFRNIEIVSLKPIEKIKNKLETVKKDYCTAGWGNINIVYYKTIEEAEKKLFESFFYIKEYQQRLRKEYENFCKLQTNRLRSEYSYVECSYCNSNIKTTGLVKHVVERVNITGARLTILEAAAGYGKTCTVYEILNQIVQNYSQKIPMFIELSKNRMANIFRYVLQDEINDKFTQLSTELVIQKIKDGRIPLIIDGFDELIQWKKSVVSVENPDEQSLTMLSTIAELLGEGSKAWILLTSRRSAIFTGDIFEEWVSTKLGEECVVERLQILKPSVEEWIGHDRYMCMIENRIAIDSISNPVLLIWIRNQSLEEVRRLTNEEDQILLIYFRMLLEREETRQLLNLSMEEIYCVLEKLASNFVQYDIMADNRDFIEDLLYDILQEDLMRYKVDYKQRHGSEAGMLSDEDYIGRLSNNSLLDRVSMTSNQIGFISEFVMGIFIGDAVRDGFLQSTELSEKYIDISATAFSSSSWSKRFDYYRRIERVLQEVGGQCRLNTEFNLLHKNNSDYENEYFNGIYFQKYYEFNSNNKFRDCFFSSCVFDHCKINGEVFVNVKFFNCQFFDVEVQGTADNCVFLGCTGCEKLKEEQDMQVEEREPIDEYERMVLEQFWKPGYSTAELRRTYTALFKGSTPNNSQNIEIALKSLLKKELLKELNVCYEINTKKMDKIKEILGR